MTECNFDGNCEECAVDEGYLAWQVARMENALEIRDYREMFRCIDLESGCDPRQ